MDAMETLIRLSSTNLNSAVKKWKGDGKKIIGYWCSYVPREIIHAAGLFPYRVKGKTCTTTSRADVFLSPIANCSFARAILELAFENKYGFLDGLVGMNSCDQARRSHELWVRYGEIPFDHFIVVPHKTEGEEVLDRYRKELVNLIEHLENYFHVNITDEALLKSIKVYNETRSLLKKLYELKKEKTPVIKGSELHAVAVAAVSTPPEQINELLNKLLDEVSEREPITDYKARLMVGGWWGDDSAFLRIVENLGGLIVADNCCFGSRDFWELVKTNGNPLNSIAESYLHRPACSRMVGEFPNRFAYLKTMVDEYNVEGIIYNRLKFCDLWGPEPFMLKLNEKELGIPMSAPLEQEYIAGDVGRVKTRCEAFIEQIEENRK
jgi:benzoyl-CoA reductase/2-hydroxyglutaryl-CoA dehydratase subunit BcrC/BadD/HgdB